jgi:methionyl aminopeptidase
MAKRKKNRVGGSVRTTHRAAHDPAGSTLTLTRREPVKPGIIGLRRQVPDNIPRPSYAETGEPPPPLDQHVRTPEQIERMRRAGALAAEVLITVGEAVEPGITTDRLDALGHETIVAAGAYPSPLNYRGFKKSLCTSVNEVICHGIPDSRRLEDGDIVNVDITVFLDGVHGDTNATFVVGDVDPEARRLIRETRTCLYRAIDAVRPGKPINVIGKAIEEHAHAEGLGVVREFIGHGICEQFHDGLQIPHYYERRAKTVIEEGMTFTIEPMITLGDPSLHIWDDEWTAVTDDGSLSAQFEHTLVVTADGAEILTQTPEGRTAAELFV